MKIASYDSLSRDPASSEPGSSLSTGRVTRPSVAPAPTLISSTTPYLDGGTATAGQGGEQTTAAPTPSFIPMPPQTDDIDHTSNPNGAPPESPAPVAPQTIDPLAFTPPPQDQGPGLQPVGSFIPMPPQGDDVDHASNPYGALNPIDPPAAASPYRFGIDEIQPQDTTPSIPNAPITQPGEISTLGTPPPVDTSYTPPVGEALTTPIADTPAGPSLPNIPGIVNNTTDGGGQQPPTLGGITDPASQYATATPTDPDNDLRGQTITPGPALDRFALAQKQLKTFNDATSPYYDASLRDATRQAAAAGRLGSGQLRTSLGDLANQRNIQLETQGQTFLNSALEGSQADSQANLAALLAEQQYQTNAQGQAFNQNVTSQQLQDSLTNSAFGRALSMLGAGNSNDPSSLQALLAQLYGQQASSASGSLGQLVGNTTTNNNTSDNSGQLSQLIAWLQSQGKSGAGAGAGDSGLGTYS